MNVFAIPQQEDIMAPRQGPTIEGVKSKLQQFQAMAGGSLIGQMEERGQRQREHWGLGRRSAMPLTDGDINIADSVAGAMMGTIKAFHGSPHRFDKFSLDKIGTGEGAQAYGHGLYFAESEGVARSYRDALIPRAGIKDDPIANAWDLANLSGGSDAMIETTIRALDDVGTDFAKQSAEALRSGAYKNYTPPVGALYTTRLNVEPDDLLDWDLPLSQQSEKVRAAVERRKQEHAALLESIPQHDGSMPFHEYDAKYGKLLERAAELRVRSDSLTGEEFVRSLGSGEQASRLLREMGIPGIRYLDQGSRASGDGTRNFVIFDDSLVDITHVDGKPLTKAERKAAIAAMMGGGAAAAAANRDDRS